MPLFLCRWPNGDCSVVLARSKRDALIKLDEVDNAEGCPLVRLDDFQVHFHLTDDGELTLEGFGEVTDGDIWHICYPVFDDVKGQVQMEPGGSNRRTMTAGQVAAFGRRFARSEDG